MKDPAPAGDLLRLDLQPNNVLSHRASCPPPATVTSRFVSASAPRCLRDRVLELRDLASPFRSGDPAVTIPPPATVRTVLRRRGIGLVSLRLRVAEIVE